MIRRISIPAFALLALTALGANAQTEDDGDWFEETEAPTEVEAAPEPEEASEPEAAPEREAAPAAPKAEKTDPVKDEPIAARPKKPGAREHDGFYLRLSLGGGSLAARGERYELGGGATDYELEGNMLSGDILVGGTPFPGFALGGAYLGDFAASRRIQGREPRDSAMSFAIVGPFLDVFPDPHGGFHIGGALGPAATVTYDDEQEENTVAAGFGGSVWVGYDFWVSDNWSLGALLRASGARVETPKSRELEGDRDRLGVGSVALMLTALYH